MSEEFFKNYFSKLNKKSKNELLDNLHRIPKVDHGVNMPQFQAVEKNYTHQADLLSMPTDKGYKYILVVVDIGSRLTDAQPLKSKTASEVLQAFKKIYRPRNFLQIPKRLEVDPGNEFKAEVKKYFNDNKVFVRVGKKARHRQQAIVERRNQIIATALFRRMAAEEILTEEPSTEWVDDLPIVIREMNKYTTTRKNKPPPSTPVCQGNSCNLLEPGTIVRVILEEPEDVAKGKRLHGTFRSTDIRWNPEIRVIKEVLIKPGFPPMYLLDGNIGPQKTEPVAYTKNQLQVVPKNEQYPSYKLIKHPENVKSFRVAKLVNKKKQGNRIYYLVKWVGYPDDQNTWEPRSKLIVDVPHLVNQYESNH